MKRKKKKLISTLLSLALVLGLMPGMNMMVQASPAGTGIDSLPGSAGAYYLTQDIIINSTWSAPTGDTTIDLNGYGIIASGTGYRVITVPNGANLTINDSGNTTHYYSVSNNIATVDENGSNSFTGGYITGGYLSGKNNNGGCALISGAMTMNGGTLIGNHAFLGGAISLTSNNASFALNGGNIIYNAAQGGGGIDKDYGSLTITGGTVEHNYATGQGDTPWDAGGIKIGGSVYLSGDPYISDNNRQNVKSNLFFQRGATIIINGTLTNTKPIGVTKHPKASLPYVFTSGWTSQMGNADPTKYFTSDVESQYVVGKNANGELFLNSPVTVTFDANGHGTAPDTKTVASGSVITRPDDPTEDFYTFDGWYKEETCTNEWNFASDKVTAATTLYAKWTAIPATAPTIEGANDLSLTYGYTEGSVSVTATAATDTDYELAYQWYSNTSDSNTDGTIIDGATDASYSIPTGKNAGTTEYYYCVVTATRMDNGETATVASDVATVTVKAVYTVTWKNWDGTVLLEEAVAEGETPEYNGEDPEKPSDAQYDYTFAGWDPEVVAVTGDAEYNATFNEAAHQHNYTYTYNWSWVNDNGTMTPILRGYCGCGDITQIATEDITVTTDGDYIVYKAHIDGYDDSEYRVKNTVTVTVNGDAAITVPKGVVNGEVPSGTAVTLTSSTKKKWLADGTVVCANAETYKFIARADVTITVEDPESEETPTFYTTLKKTDTGKARFEAGWTMPDGYSVQSAYFYRIPAKTDTVYNEDQMQAQGKKAEISLRSQYASYGANLSSSANNYFNTMLFVTYKDKTGAVQTYNSEILQVAIR